MVVRDTRGSPVALGQALASGGEGVIYPVQGQPRLLAKIYNRPRDEYERKLAWMKANPPAESLWSADHAPIAWPCDLLYDDRGRFIGYLMPYIRAAVPLLDVFNPRRRAAILPGFNWKYLHRTARNLAAALALLHRRGYVVGDLNESNVLVTPRALVTLIDVDSFQVRGQDERGETIFPCPVGKPEYTPRELQGSAFQQTLRQPEHDRFGLGVLIFQLLMDGNHPFRSRWLAPGEPLSIEEKISRGCFPYGATSLCPVAPPPHAPTLEMLHPEVARLVLRCFVNGHRNPRQRPAPEEWKLALEAAERSLVQCANGHYSAAHLRHCPRCGGARRFTPAVGPVPPARVVARAVVTPRGTPGPALAVRWSAPSWTGVARAVRVSTERGVGALRRGSRLAARRGARLWNASRPTRLALLAALRRAKRWAIGELTGTSAHWGGSAVVGVLAGAVAGGLFQALFPAGAGVGFLLGLTVGVLFGLVSVANLGQWNQLLLGLLFGGLFSLLNATMLGNNLAVTVVALLVALLFTPTGWALLGAQAFIGGIVGEILWRIVAAAPELPPVVLPGLIAGASVGALGGATSRWVKSWFD